MAKDKKSIFDSKPDKVKQFQASSKGVTEVVKREIETQLLKPENIVKYTGEEPKHKSDLSARTVLIVFRNTTQMELIGNLFEIRESKVNHDTYITNIQLLETIAQSVKDGTMGIINGQIQVLSADKVPVGGNEAEGLSDEGVLEKVIEATKVDPEAVVDLDPEVLEAAEILEFEKNNKAAMKAQKKAKKEKKAAKKEKKAAKRLKG